MTRLFPRFSVIAVKKFGFFVCFAALAAAVSAKADSVVYDNSSLNSFSSGGRAISGGYSTTDSFSLSSPATIDAISFGNWLDAGSTLDSVDWEITTALDGGTVVGSGTATAISSVLKQNLDPYKINDSTFGITSLSLAADTTYYLELYDGVASDSGYIYWDVSNNPNSTGYQSGGGYSNLVVSSETFALYGNDIAATPEPSSLLLLGSGLAGLVLAGAMRRRSRVTPQTTLGV